MYTTGTVFKVRMCPSSVECLARGDGTVHVIALLGRLVCLNLECVCVLPRCRALVTGGRGCKQVRPHGRPPLSAFRSLPWSVFGGL